MTTDTETPAWPADELEPAIIGFALIEEYAHEEITVSTKPPVTEKRDVEHEAQTFWVDGPQPVMLAGTTRPGEISLPAAHDESPLVAEEPHGVNLDYQLPDVRAALISCCDAAGVAYPPYVHPGGLSCWGCEMCLDDAWYRHTDLLPGAPDADQPEDDWFEEESDG